MDENLKKHVASALSPFCGNSYDFGCSDESLALDAAEAAINAVQSYKHTLSPEEKIDQMIAILGKEAVQKMGKQMIEKIQEIYSPQHPAQIQYEKTCQALHEAMEPRTQQANIKISYAGRKPDHLEPVELPDDHFDRPTQNTNHDENCYCGKCYVAFKRHLSTKT